MPDPSRTLTVRRSGELPDVRALCLTSSASVQDAIALIDKSGRFSIALVVDEYERLVNTVSDGDVRRGILAGVPLTAPVAELLSIKARTPHPLPVCAPLEANDASLLASMQLYNVRQIPLIDAARRVVDIVTLAELLSDPPPPLQAVVMAGGFGTRLRPLTEGMPKPMLPVGGRPLIERIVENLRQTGIRKICIATYYESDKIVRHFGDGSAFGVEISYTNEAHPLGTGGALGLMERPCDPVVVMNGDIVTDIDLRAMQSFHQEHMAKMTVAVRRYEVQVPFGVVDSDGVHLRAVREKPAIGFFVNAGIYLLEPDVYRYITAGAHLNMTDLIDTLLRANENVVSFPVREFWLDIGQHSDYAQAQTEAFAATGRRSTE